MIGRDLAHRAALERRQQQPPLAQVLGAVEHEHRALAQRGRQGRVRLARVQVGLVAGEQLADRVRIGDVDALAEDQQRTVNTSP